MAKRVSDGKSRYDYLKVDIITGEIIEEFSTFMLLKEAYPNVGKTVVMSCCNGHKLSYMGYIWRYRDKSTNEIIVPEYKISLKPEYYYLIDEKIFLGGVIASKNLGISSSTFYFRIKSPNFPNYQKLKINNPLL